MADSIKRWWQRRLCIKRARQRGGQHHRSDLRHQWCQQSPKTKREQQQANSGTVENDAAASASSADRPWSIAEEAEPQHPPPPPVQLSRTTFASVLPRVASRLHTIHEEEDASRSVNSNANGQASSQEEATATANDYCPSDDLDSRAIFDSDPSEPDRASMERRNRTRNNAKLEDIEELELGAAVAAVKQDDDNELEDDDAALDAVTLSEVFTTTMTRTGTATTTCSSPSPSIAPRRSPSTAPAWLQTASCRRISCHGHSRKFKKLAESPRPRNSRGNCGGGVGTVDDIGWPSVRLEKVTIHPLTAALSGCRGACVETRGRSGRGRCGDLSDVEDEDDYSANCRRRWRHHQQSPSPDQPSEAAVFGIACALQSSDMRTTCPSSSPDSANNLSAKSGCRAAPKSTNLSNVYGQPTAGMAAANQPTPVGPAKRQSSRITRIWLDVESSSSGKEQVEVEKEKKRSKERKSSEEETEEESEEEPKEEPEQEPTAIATENSAEEAAPARLSAERKVSGDKKIKVKRDPRSSHHVDSDNEGPVFVYEATVPIDSAANADDGLKAELEVGGGSLTQRAGGDKPDGQPEQSGKLSDGGWRSDCFNAARLPLCNCCCCASQKCHCCHGDYPTVRPAETASAGCCCGCQHRCSCCCRHCGNHSSRGAACGPAHRCCQHHHQHQMVPHQPCSYSAGFGGGYYDYGCSAYQPPMRYINPHSPSQFDLSEPWIWQPPVSPAEHCQQLINVSEGQAKRTIAEAEQLCKMASKQRAEERQEFEKANESQQAAGRQEKFPAAAPASGNNIANNWRASSARNSWLMTASLTDHNSQLTDLALLTSSDDIRSRPRRGHHPRASSPSSGFRSTSLSSASSICSSARVTIQSSREGDCLADANGRCRISTSSSDAQFAKARRL